MRSGFAHLPLHGGKAPSWLFDRMVLLAREVLAHIVAEHGPAEPLRRLSDPFWFQAFGCVLGFDWHSSGVTTTVCGAVKEGIKGRERDYGFFAAGGKGATSRKTPAEVHCGRRSRRVRSASTRVCEPHGGEAGFGRRPGRLRALPSCVLLHPAGEWCIVQEGMSDATRTARRYLVERRPAIIG